MRILGSVLVGMLTVVLLQTGEVQAARAKMAALRESASKKLQTVKRAVTPKSLRSIKQKNLDAMSPQALSKTSDKLAQRAGKLEEQIGKRRALRGTGDVGKSFRDMGNDLSGNLAHRYRKRKLEATKSRLQQVEGRKLENQLQSEPGNKGLLPAATMRDSQGNRFKEQARSNAANKMLEKK